MKLYHVNTDYIPSLEVPETIAIFLASHGAHHLTEIDLKCVCGATSYERNAELPIGRPTK